MKVTLVDYGAGNLPSVERALQKLGAESCRANTSASLASAEVLVLPGVGHFGALIHALDERALRAPLLELLERGVPFLGICLGLHALYDSSEEAPELRGLRLLPGRVRALPPDVKLPHMGWNHIHAVRTSRLLDGIDPGAHFYFAHSYAAVPALLADDDNLVATCNHGADFVAVLESHNLCAVQFHPEKSASPGAQLLRNFLRLSA